ncbi:TIGR01777 family oxidoreductase [Flavobacterium artemisiae]|uniref:TIGR01777 family oxidoreductase n=1 Tax=Flavobacterium artemisiae TaxID=2126556 RepID=A0ABW4H9M8_9FLAO
MPKNVLLTGGTGFIGSHLVELLLDNGYTVSVLSRSAKKSNSQITYYQWNLKQNFIDEEAVLKADFIIHLAGEGIVEKRWTKRRKKAIIDSRVQPIELIHSVLVKHNKTFDAFISASGIGIYGAKTNHKICTENMPPADDFLGITCQKWENAVDAIGALQIRTVKVRTGIVMGKDEGFMKKMIPTFKSGFGAVMGSGKQYLPWIYIDDLCRIYLKAITDEKLEGPYNACVTDNTTNSRFSKTLANLFGYTIWLPKIPPFFLRLLLGEMSKAILEGQRVSSEKIQQTGFEFQFTDLEKTLINCIK